MLSDKMLRWVTCFVVVSCALGILAETYREIQFKNCKSSTGSLSCKVKYVLTKGCYPPTPWVAADGTVVEYQPDDGKSPCRLVPGSMVNFSIAFEPGYHIGSPRSHFSVPDCLAALGPVAASGCPVTSAAPESACGYTKCPIEPAKQYRFEYSLPISQGPARPTNDRVITQMRWKLWNNKKKTHSCCFTIPIQY